MLPNLLYVGNKLSRHGHTLTGIEILGPLLESEGFQVRYASGRKNKVRRMAAMAASVVRNRKWAQYVLIDTYSTQNFWYAYIVAVLCQVCNLRYIPILHGGNLPSRLDKSPRASRRIFKYSHVNVAPSGYLEKAFDAAGFPVVRIPNPFHQQAFSFMDRKTFGPRLIWVRSLAPIYDPMMALRALRDIAVRYPDASLQMVGPDRGLRHELGRYADLHGLRVTFAGRQTQAAWAAIATQCDIFINTSTADNAPFSLLEAASLGLAIVSTDVGGIPHLFPHGAINLVAPGDSSAMASAVAAIISNPDAARKQVAVAFEAAWACTWPNVRFKWLEILR